MRGIDVATKGLISSGMTTASKGFIRTAAARAVIPALTYIILWLTSTIRNTGIALNSTTEVRKK